MKRQIVIFLLCLYVFSATEAGELLRLPWLVGHFITHKQQDEAITFFGFMSLHYGNVDSEDYKDTRLPFKSPDHSVFISHVFAIPPSVCSALDTPCIHNEAQLTIYRQQLLKPAYLSCIWQPPKSC